MCVHVCACVRARRRACVRVCVCVCKFILTLFYSLLCNGLYMCSTLLFITIKLPMILKRTAARNHLKIKDSAGGLVDHVTRGFAGPFDNGFGVTGLLGQAVGEGRADVERNHLGAETT